MDKKTVAAIVISLGIWLTWQKFYWEPHQKAQKEWREYQQAEREKNDPIIEQKNFDTGKSSVGSPAITNNSVIKGKSTQNLSNKRPIEVQTISFSNNKTTFSNSPHLINDWTISDYFTNDENDEKRKPIDLLYHSGVAHQVEVSFSNDELTRDISKNFQPQSVGSRQNEQQDSYTDVLNEKGFFIQRKITPAKTEHTVHFDLEMKFNSEVPKYVFIDLLGNTKREHDTQGSIFGETPDKVEVVYWNTEGRHSEIADQIYERKEVLSGINWLGINTRYFLFAIIPDSKEMVNDIGLQIQSVTKGDQKLVQARLVVATRGEKSLKIPFRMYFGPKKLELLEAITPSLGNAIDFGWTSVIAIPLLKMLKSVYSIVGNYGIAIIIVTIFVKILLFPLTYKSMKSMAKLTRLKPEMEKIQKKYADDKQKLNQEIWNLYKNNGANPLSGCLPMLLQMPVFFALYRVLFNCMELYQAPFFFWIKDLSAKDPFYITPVLLIFLMYIQQKLTPQTNADPSQQAAMKFMPVIFGVFMLFLPSGLNIYMLINTKVSLLQQYFLNKKFGVGGVVVT